MLKLHLTALVGLAACLASPAAFAQYREGQPPTLQAPPPADPDAPANAILNQFARWNAAAGRPRILVFWNRVLTDETATREDKHVSENETTRNGKTVVQDTTTTQFGSASKTDDDSISERKYDSVETSKVTTGGKYASLDPLASRVLEDTFVNIFLTSGAQIVDRDALIRKISASLPKSERLDLQLLESKALEQNITYLIEVLPDADKNAPSGALYSINVMHLPSSTVVTKFITSGAVPRGAPHYVATPNGFKLTSEDRTSPERVAAQVAVEAMSRLSASVPPTG